jgi:hypothetical protein
MVIIPIWTTDYDFFWTNAITHHKPNSQFFFFWHGVLLYSPSWSQIHTLPISTTWVLRLQDYSHVIINSISYIGKWLSKNYYMILNNSINIIVFICSVRKMKHLLSRTWIWKCFEMYIEQCKKLWVYFLYSLFRK